MKYLVCTVDGELHDRTATGTTHDVITAEVGPEGFDFVRIRRGLWRDRLCGYVNDVGLLYPQTYPRNVVGSCLLAALGANAQPYAGSVVLTGWDEYGDPTEVTSVDDAFADIIRQTHGAVRYALGLDDVPVGADDGWSSSMAELAEYVRTGPTPAIQILTLDEALEALRGAS